MNRNRNSTRPASVTQIPVPDIIKLPALDGDTVEDRLKSALGDALSVLMKAINNPKGEGEYRRQAVEAFDIVTGMSMLYGVDSTFSQEASSALRGSDYQYLLRKMEDIIEGESPLAETLQGTTLRMVLLSQTPSL